MSQSDLLAVLDGLGHPRVLVLGDLILDRYTWGNAERVSQEAPVILLRAEQREARLGGAANVCQMLRGLEAEVACAGVVGADADGKSVREQLRDAGVDDRFLLYDESRPTTVKERFIGRAQGRHPHQILRVDSEVRDPLCSRLEGCLAAQLASAVAGFQVVLVSDYGKGVCTPELLRAVITAANASRVPVVVDPIRSTDYSPYRGATTMTPNRLEAEMATGVRIARPEDAYAAGKKLCEQLDLQMAIVTLDSDGMALVERDGLAAHFPTRKRDVYDITGAGDMVLAMIGVCLGAGVSTADALRLGNIAGGLEVEKVGVVVIPREEIRTEIMADRSARLGHRGVRNGGQDLKLVRPEALGVLAEQLRQKGRRIVFTNGCFDLLHVGHVSYLQEAAALGSCLIVGVNSDASVRKLKGPTRPIISEAERAQMLAALACVDHVVIFGDDTPHALLHALHPDVLVKGGTYTPEQVVGHEVVEAYGGQVCVTGVVDGISTTNILASLAARHGLKGPHVESPDNAHVTKDQEHRAA
ncbi:MAG: D-glycero-beta-D-manno-heptose 1-phosphate adenylyltransferase [Planctomycetes bacterium]|nr:D-glycero-beta-D-manno-heptose 1-phosphate adenylyltransferase [Planctomycetota bacterium]